MFKCCLSGPGLSKSQTALVQGHLLQLDAYLPGCTTFALLNAKGEVMVYCGNEPRQRTTSTDGLPGLPQIKNLLGAAQTLSSALQSYGCPVIHTKGLQMLCSCYQLGRAQLGIVTVAAPHAIELLDLAALDLQLAPHLLQVQNNLEIL